MPIYKTGKTKDGKAQYRVFVSYVTDKGEYKKKSKLVFGLSEAKSKEIELIQDLTIPRTKVMTVNDLVKLYSKAQKNEVRETTHSKNQRVIKAEIAPILGKYRLEKLTSSILLDWKLKVGEKGRSVRYNQNIYKTLNALLNFAVKMEFIDKNPLKKVGNFSDPNFEAQDKQIHYYTKEQFEKYIEQAKPKGDNIQEWKFYIFFLLAYFTGARKGEINALKWSDLEGDILHIRRSITQKVKGIPELETPPKNKSSIRGIRLPQNVLKLLKHYKQIQMKIPRFSDDFRICGAIKTISDSSLYNKNKLFAEKAGLPKIKIHEFRHSHASLLSNNSVLIQEVSRRLGHSDVKLTWNTYSHLYPAQEEKALGIMNDFEV